jgi:hypothetical protein
MTDSELLERAARAAGIETAIIYDGDDERGWGPYVKTGKHQYWRPLDDDGDALRLAVKLQLTIANEHINAGVAYCTRPLPGGGLEEDTFPEVQSGTNESELIPEDYAATRRAIVLAAAALA